MAKGVEISKRLVLVNSASSILVRLLDVSVLIWLQQYLLRRITPEEYSLYPVVMSVVAFVPLLTTVLTSGLGRYTVEAYAKGDEREITQITSTMFPLLLVAGAMLLTLGLGLAWHVEHILKISSDHISDARIMVVLLMVPMAAGLALAPFGVGLYVRQKFVFLNALHSVGVLLRVILLAALLFGMGARVLWVAVASVCSQLGAQVVQFVASRRALPALAFRFSEIRWSMVPRLVSFGTWNSLGSLASAIRRASDPFILNRLATPVDVSCFYLGNLAYTQMEDAIVVVTAPIQPVATTMYVTGGEDRLRSTYLRVGRYALWAYLLVMVPLMIYRRELVLLYVGEHYLDAAMVMTLLLGTAPFWYGHVMLPTLAHAKAELGPFVWRSFLIQLINIVLTLYLVGAWGAGALGSALGTFIANVIGVLLLIYPLAFRLTRLTMGRWLSETLVPGVLPGIIAAGILWGLRITVAPTTWAALVPCVGAGALCYASCIALFGLQPEDCRDLLKLAGRHPEIPLRPLATRLLKLRLEALK